MTIKNDITQLHLTKTYTETFEPNLHKYDIKFDIKTKTFLCNNFICFSNIYNKKGTCYLSDEEIIIFTKDGFGAYGNTSKALGVYFINKHHLLYNDKTSVYLLDTLKTYISSNTQLFEDFIKDKHKIQKQCFVYHTSKHMGHDIIDEVLNWGVSSKELDGLKLVGNSLFFNTQQLLSLFKTVDIFQNDEELFKNMCQNRYMLYRMRHGPSKFDNSFLKILNTQPNTHTQTCVCVFLKQDDVCRTYLNGYDFYLELFKIFKKYNVKIKVYGFIQLTSSNKYYVDTAAKCQAFGEKLLKTGYEFEFFNNISINDFIQHASTFDYYVSPPGSLQHIVHCFATNLKRGLVCGDVNIGFFKNYKQLMNYLSLPLEFLDYLDFNQDNITKQKNINHRSYNILFKHLENLEVFLVDNFLNV